MKTVRHQILEALINYLNAYPWQSAPLTVVPALTMVDPEATPLPVLAFLPTREETTRSKYGTDQNAMSVELPAVLRLALNEGQVESAIEATEPVLGEIHQAMMLAAQHASLIDLVDEITYQGGGVDEWPASQGQVIITVGATFSVVYQTQTGNPFL